MSRRISIAILSTLFVISSLVIQAHEPPPTPYPLPADVELPEPTDDRDVPARILRIFDGMKNGEILELEPTGDLVVDDIMRVRHQRGSVLERFPGESDLGLKSPSGESGESTEARIPSQTAHAAEQLLKAARQLEAFAADDSQRADLIDRMREEAGKLLSE